MVKKLTNCDEAYVPILTSDERRRRTASGGKKVPLTHIATLRPHESLRGIASRLVFSKTWGVIIVSVTLLAFTGCGGDWSSVSGKLSLDGKPLASGENRQVTLMFQPESGGGPPAAAQVDSSGYYTLSTGSRGGLPPGNYVVTISAMDLSFPAGPNNPPVRRLITPLKYAQPEQSGLRCVVQPGRNQFDFGLDSDENATTVKQGSL